MGLRELAAGRLEKVLVEYIGCEGIAAAILSRYTWPIQPVIPRRKE